MSVDQMNRQRDSGDEALAVAAELRAALERAVAFGGRPVYRLGSARTSVTFSVEGHPDAAVTLLLDRHPPEVLSGDEPAEVAIDFSREQAEVFVRGELILPNEIMAGAVLARGPVRSYLRADPVLRALLVRAQR